MYLRLSCTIVIANKYTIRGVHEVKIVKSVHQLIQTATLLLPISFVLRNQEQVKQVKLIDNIKEGDSIRIELGYNDKNRQEFSGYIRRINLVSPLEINCEDDFYLLRKLFFKASFRKINLPDLLAYILERLNKKHKTSIVLFDKIPDFTFTNFIIKDGTGIEILQELKDKYGLTCFITEMNGKPTLYCGLAFSLEKGNVKYTLDRNTVNTSDLKFETSGDKKYRIRIINFSKSGLKTEIEIGDKNGELRTLHFYGNNDLKTLKQKAAGEMEKFKTEGYSGSFETFLIPYCEPGTLIDLNNEQFPERKGKYFISAVTTVFDSNGGRRKPEIGIKISGHNEQG